MRRVRVFNAIVTVVAYLGQRPTLVRVAVSLGAVIAGLCGYSYLEWRLPTKEQTGAESARQAAPPSPRPPSAEAARATFGDFAGSSTARHGEQAPTPAKAAPQTKSIVAQPDPALEAWFIKSYLRCWTPPSTLPQGGKYAAQIRVIHNADGSLSASPLLVNPPSDPEWRAYADSAIRAVAKCPLQIPARYLPHFDQWRRMTLHFSPDGEL